jgi:hypothetical protein
MVALKGFYFHHPKPSLHQFRIHRKRHGIAWMGGILFSDDPEAVRLKDLGLRVGARANSQYFAQ